MCDCGDLYTRRARTIYPRTRVRGICLFPENPARAELVVVGGEWENCIRSIWTLRMYLYRILAGAVRKGENIGRIRFADVILRRKLMQVGIYIRVYIEMRSLVPIALF